MREGGRVGRREKEEDRERKKEDRLRERGTKKLKKG